MDIRIDQANNILKAFEVPKTLQQIFDEAKAKIVEATDEADIQKGGEGSKGGKVIGHTRSGKAIYENHNHESHKDFTPNDHHDAYNLHSDIEGELYKKRDKIKPTTDSEHPNNIKRGEIMDKEITPNYKSKYYHEDQRNEKAKPKHIVISNEKPLSPQLEKETGDMYNANDYSGSTAFGEKLIHNKTGKTFHVMNENEHKNYSHLLQ